MSYRKALMRLLDRPGGRFALGKIASHFVRHLAVDDVEILYSHGLWTHRVGSHFFPDNQTFSYTYTEYNEWKRQRELYISQTKDFWLQLYEPREGDVIVDIGAGRGEDTLTFSCGVGASGRVIAIEAHPLSFAILKEFCRLNGLTNVTPVHLALMDKAGRVRIREAESWMENAIDCGEGLAGIPVQAGTLDDVCHAHGIKNIAFVKMNIEGAERQALLGMESVLAIVRRICVACHDFRSDMGHGEQFRTREFVKRFLMERGFEVTSRRDDPRDYVRDHVFGSRPA